MGCHYLIVPRWHDTSCFSQESNPFRTCQRPAVFSKETSLNLNSWLCWHLEQRNNGGRIDRRIDRSVRDYVTCVIDSQVMQESVRGKWRRYPCNEESRRDRPRLGWMCEEDPRNLIEIYQTRDRRCQCCSSRLDWICVLIQWALFLI